MTRSWWDRQNNGFDEFLQRGSHISLTQRNKTTTLKMEAIAAVRYLAIGKISCGLSNERSDYTTKYNTLTVSHCHALHWKCTPCTLIKRGMSCTQVRDVIFVFVLGHFYFEPVFIISCSVWFSVCLLFSIWFSCSLLSSDFSSLFQFLFISISFLVGVCFFPDLLSMSFCVKVMYVRVLPLVGALLVLLVLTFSVLLSLGLV